ncbi:MAG: urease accessory protein [Acidobacteriota bacterium]|jgi:urease accessory protein|nr:urease accessory protein [Acidobacteriota bacterium]
MENRQPIRKEDSSSTLLYLPAASVYRVRGHLRLCFESDSSTNQTVLASCQQQPPLRVVRAFSLTDGGSLVHLHNLSGGVLGGDYLTLDVEVGCRASAQLTSTGATRLYQSRCEAPTAVQINEIKVGENALLEYLPDALIPFKGSRYRQETRIELAAGAGLFWWEMVAPGREARQEIFAYELLQLKLDIEAAGKSLAQERIKLEPARRPLSSLVRLGHYRYFSTFYICRVGLEAARWLALEKQLTELADELSRDSEILWGVSTLPAHGLVVRALSIRGRAITSGLMAFWQAAKLQLYGQQAIPPRKVN